MTPGQRVFLAALERQDQTAEITRLQAENARLTTALTVAASRMEVASADWGIAYATGSDKLTYADDMGQWAKDARAALKR